MKLGRNDPCSCGSGKKYKHCCLNAGSVPATAPGDLTWRRLRALVDGYATQMLRFTAEAYGPLAVDEAWNEFMCDDDLEFDPDTPLMPLFMPWFFHCWSPDPIATMVGAKSLHNVIRPTFAKAVEDWLTKAEHDRYDKFEPDPWPKVRLLLQTE